MLSCRRNVMLSFLCLLNFLFLTTVSFAALSQEKFFNPDAFFGERIDVGGTKSARINSIRLILQFPRDHKMLFHAKPSMKLFTQEGKFIKEFPIRKNSSSFTLNKRIPSEKLYCEVELYYCREGSEGMCLLKNLLFEIKLDKNLPADDIFLAYTVSAE